MKTIESDDNTALRSGDRSSAPIDAVITWVDGDDPDHAAKRDFAKRAAGGRKLVTGVPSGRSNTRFKNNGELCYCIMALRKYAPWIRDICIVTDGQQPRFLNAKNMRRLSIRIVDHKEIFQGYEWALPTFNSRTIETMIYRIEGLAERFLYLNDDFLLLAPTDKSDFFDGDRVVVRGEKSKLTSTGTLQLLKSSLLNHAFEGLFKQNRPMHILPQMRAAKMAGFSDYFIKDLHTPFAVRRSTISTYFMNNPGRLSDNIRYKFRDMLQFNTMPLANHLEIAADRHVYAPTGNCLTISFSRKSLDDVDKEISQIAAGKIRFFCIQSLELAEDRHRDEIYRQLNGLIGDPTEFFA